MTIKSVEDLWERGVEVDLTGPQGNAMYLMSMVNNLCTDHDMDSDAILADMKSGDYEHLIKVFDAAFGDFVTLYR